MNDFIVTNPAYGVVTDGDTKNFEPRCSMVFSQFHMLSLSLSPRDGEPLIQPLCAGLTSMVYPNILSIRGGSKNGFFDNVVSMPPSFSPPTHQVNYENICGV
jgi:hypothetical protein